MPTLVPASEDVRVYELNVMYAPDLSPKEESQALKEIDGILGEAGAKIIFKDAWSKRGLAYRIKGQSEAKFIILYIEAEPKNVRQIDRSVRLEKNVLRHLLVIPPKGYEAVSFEEKYKHWIVNRESAADMREREKEERLKEKVQAKAKMDAKRVEAQKRKTKKDEPAMEAGQITQELDRLISDEDLKI